MIQNTFRIYVIATIFIALIAFPILNDEFKFVKDIESSENRKMASKPVMNFSYLDPYPAQYEKYYDDNFSIRSLMVRYFNLINIKAFRKSPVPDKVVIGKDNWLFMAGKELETYQGINRFEVEELEAYRLELEYRKKYLEERDIKYYFMIAPVKASIYPEKMPNMIFRYTQQSWGEQLIDYMDKNSDFKIIDLYEVLRARKEQELVYFMLDNHWNQLGAFYSAYEFFSHVDSDLPGFSVIPPEEYTISKSEISTGNIFSMISKIGYDKDYSFMVEPKSGFLANDVKPVGYPVVKGFPYPHEYEMDKEIPGSDKPKIVIICDSYGGNIFPFIAENFSRSVKIFDCWQYKLNEDIVNSEKPDVVLVVALESNLKALLDFQSRLNPE